LVIAHEKTAQQPKEIGRETPADDRPDKKNQTLAGTSVVCTDESEEKDAGANIFCGVLLVAFS